jgi:hypothetical protein
LAATARGADYNAGGGETGPAAPPATETPPAAAPPAAGAQTWADHLVAIGQDVHSTCCGAFKDYGENLAWRVHDYIFKDIVGHEDVKKRFRMYLDSKEPLSEN